MLDFISLAWEQLIMGPMVNSLVFLYSVLFNNFGLSILVFTVVVRLLTFPLTVKQIRMTRSMSQLQPIVKQVQEKYKGDRQRISQETMRIYREHKVSPLGCLGPMFVQMPIWIGLYQGIIQTLPSQPERLIGLSQKLYSWLPYVNEAVPLSSKFLWMDLSLGPGQQNDFLLPALVGISMWAVQKMSTIPSADPRTAQTNQLMLWMMPIMLTFFSFQLPSGLALFWVSSNLIQMGIQYFIAGWGNLIPTKSPPKAPTQPDYKESEQDGDTRSDGQDSRGVNRDRPRTTRRRPRSGRSRRS